MFITLPFLTLSLIFLNLSSFGKTRKLLFRERILISLTIWALLFALITETLSLFNLIYAAPIIFSWSAVCFLLLIVVLKSPPGGHEFMPSIKPAFKHDFLSKIMITCIFIILSITFILALTVAPNNMGAMTYHLARIPHWLQNHNVNYYATNISWQISIAPWASYPQLHFYLLSNTDRFANLVQWIFASGTLVGVSLMAKKFGAGLREQIVTVFIGVTIPMGILQSSTTHDPYIVAFFLVCFIYFALLFHSSQKFIMLLISVASLGLALFTKQTAYVFSFPFFLWVLWLWIKKFGFKQGLYYMLVLSLVVVSINSPFYIRNLIFLGWPVFSIRSDYINNPIGIISLVSGVIKNLALHFSTPFLALNSRTHEVLSSIFQLFNIPENNPNLNWTNQPFGIPPVLASEYTAPNTIHLILFIASALLISLKKRRDNLMRGYILCIVLGFVLFSTIFRWQASGSHLQFPLFALSAPIIGRGIMMFKRSLRYILIPILALASLYYLFFNLQKPIISDRSIFTINRDEQYFMFRPELYKAYKKIGGFVEKGKYKNVGVVIEENYSDFEYPLWVILGQKKDIIFEHIDVENPTERFSKGFKPEVVIFFGQNRNVLKKYLGDDIPVIGISR